MLCVACGVIISITFFMDIKNWTLPLVSLSMYHAGSCNVPGWSTLGLINWSIILVLWVLIFIVSMNSWSVSSCECEFKMFDYPVNCIKLRLLLCVGNV